MISKQSSPKIAPRLTDLQTHRLTNCHALTLSDKAISIDLLGPEVYNEDQWYVLPHTREWAAQPCFTNMEAGDRVVECCLLGSLSMRCLGSFRTVGIAARVGSYRVVRGNETIPFASRLRQSQGTINAEVMPGISRHSLELVSKLLSAAIGYKARGTALSAKQGSRRTSVRLRALLTSGLAHRLFARSRFKISFETSSAERRTEPLEKADTP